VIENGGKRRMEKQRESEREGGREGVRKRGGGGERDR